MHNTTILDTTFLRNWWIFWKNVNLRNISFCRSCPRAPDPICHVIKQSPRGPIPEIWNCVSMHPSLASWLLGIYLVCSLLTILPLARTRISTCRFQSITDGRKLLKETSMLSHWTFIVNHTLPHSSQHAPSPPIHVTSPTSDIWMISNGYGWMSCAWICTSWRNMGWDASPWHRWTK